MTRNNNQLAALIIRLLLKKPLWLLILFSIGSGYYFFSPGFKTGTTAKNSSITFQGLPQAQSLTDSLANQHTVLTNQAFMVGYSDKRGNPLWVAYRLKPVPADAPLLKRPSRFTVDKRVSNQVSHDDYDKSGYDRGHLAPNYAISALYGKQAQQETFLMTNISPQTPSLNRKLWQRLEEVEVKYFTQVSAPVWVTTGPIFAAKAEILTSSNNYVEIPAAFYKLYAMQKNGKTYLLGFIMPQQVKGNEPLDQYVATVDKIEQLTGFDFFHELPDAEENALEAKIDTGVWQLAQVSRLPGRY